MPAIPISSVSRSASPVTTDAPKPEGESRLELLAGKKRSRDGLLIPSPPRSSAHLDSQLSTATPDIPDDKSGQPPTKIQKLLAEDDQSREQSQQLLTRLERIEEVISQIPSLRNTLERLSAPPRPPSPSPKESFLTAAEKARSMSIYEFSASWINGTALIGGQRSAPILCDPPCSRCHNLGLVCQTLAPIDMYFNCIPGVDDLCCGWCTRELEFSTRRKPVILEEPYRLSEFSGSSLGAYHPARLKVPPTRVQWCVSDEGIDEEVIEEDIRNYMGETSKAYRKDYDEYPVGHGFFIVADAGFDLHESTMRELMTISARWENEKRQARLEESRSLGRQSEYRRRSGDREYGPQYKRVPPLESETTE